MIRGNEGPPRGPAFAATEIVPSGASLPAGFREQPWQPDGSYRNPSACLVSAAPCSLLVIDLDGDGTPEVLAFREDPPGGGGVAATEAAVYRRDEHGVWRKAGTLSWPFGRAIASSVLAGIRAGRAVPIPPVMPDLDVDGQRLHFKPLAN